VVWHDVAWFVMKPHGVVRYGVMWHGVAGE
jgi:hypothetical protein